MVAQSTAAAASTSKVSKVKKEKKEAANSKKRNRVPISCTICRRRKVKCDKKRPVCTACNRTGVAHLCHYIDPPWAQPLQSSEIAPPQEPQNEVEKLKEKIRQLESQLYPHNDHLPSPNEDQDDNESNSSQDRNSTNDGLPDESLNLGKKFDMLHIKSTTTVHLGATSWLAIMKGDPYLRVLWSHIFKMRKKVEEVKFKNKLVKHQKQQQEQQANRSKNENQQEPQGVCPVSGKADISGGAQCPVSHNMFSRKLSEPTCPVIPSAPLSASRCPVSNVRSQLKDSTDSSGQTSEDNNNTPETETSQNPELHEKVCPLMIGDSSLLSNFDSHNESNCPVLNEKKRKRTMDDEQSKKQTKPKLSDKKKAALNYIENPVMMLESHLPTKKTLWLHIKRFFEVLYVYMPYVDEPSLIEEMKFIFGEENDEDQKIKVKIRSGVDFALVGTVCIILRLSWHTLPMNNSSKLLKKSTHSKTYQEDQSIIAHLQKPENEIPLKLVDCVQQCFSNLKLMRKSSLKIVQCGLYMRLYFMYSPDDGDGADGADSQIFLGMIIQMAISIGLHRDPKNFENFSNERQRHLWRKIWFKLISLDVTQSMNLGCPRALQNHIEFSDTELPGDSNDGLTLEEFKDDLKELTIIKNIRTQAKVDDFIAKTMKVLLNVNKPARRFQVDNLIDQLEQCINGFGIINDKYALPQIGKILVNRSKNEKLYVSGTRAIEFRLHVTVNMLLYLLNYILYVHFEPRGSQDPHVAKLAKNYAQKALNCALEGYRNCTLFFDCGVDYFGPGADIVLAPLLLLVGHRSMQFMVSLILRSRCGPFMKPNIVQPTNSIGVNNENNGVMDPQSGLNKIDNRNHDLNGIEIKDESEQFTSIFKVDVDSGEVMSTILLGHMESFHKLAGTLGQRYSYSWRMGKAVGFFVTLLKKPVNIVKDLVKTESINDVENDTGVANVLNSVPLDLSTEEERMSKEKAEQSNTTINTPLVQENYSKPEPVPVPEYNQSNLFNPFFDNLEAKLISNPNDMIDQFKNDLQQSEKFLNLNDSNQEMSDSFGFTGMPDLNLLQGSTSPLDNFIGLDSTSNKDPSDSGVDFSSLMSNSWFN